MKEELDANESYWTIYFVNKKKSLSLMVGWRRRPHTILFQQMMQDIDEDQCYVTNVEETKLVIKNCSYWTNTQHWDYSILYHHHTNTK